MYCFQMLKVQLSVGNNTRKLNKICSGNVYPFSPDSIMEHILATTNESRLGDKVKFSPSIFKIVYTDDLKPNLS